MRRRLISFRVTTQKVLVSGGAGEVFALGPWQQPARIKEIRLLQGGKETDFLIRLQSGFFGLSPRHLDLLKADLPSETIQVGSRLVLQVWYTGKDSAIFSAMIYLYVWDI